jgi:uncharacterized membrane protein (DUF4010 family)
MPDEVSQIELFARFGAALVAGLLVGLQREYAFRDIDGRAGAELFAGVRTFGLLALLGAGAALAADILASPLIFFGFLLVVSALVTVGYYIQSKEGDIGMTTEIAALITVVIGALCYWNMLALAAALAVVTTVILALKLQTQSLVSHMKREDVYATLQFAVISAVILPVLPREPIAPPPFDVLIPYRIWLLVVFISGISFTGYLLIKLVGASRGVGLTGVLGGMVSSTAVTLSFAQRSRRETTMARAFGLAVILAWTIMFVRVLIEVAVVNAPLLSALWMPLSGAMAAGLAYCVYLYRSQQGRAEGGEENFENPFELRPAITFGLLFAVVLLVANVAQMYLGSTGVYLSAIASGAADVDAITLSMADLSRQGALDDRTAALAIVLAVITNTAVKGGIVLVLGGPGLRRIILPGLLLMLATAAGLAFTV